MLKLLQITVPYACFGLEIDDAGLVVRAAPIARWTVGRYWAEVANYYVLRKKGTADWVLRHGDGQFTVTEARR